MALALGSGRLARAPGAAGAGRMRSLRPARGYDVVMRRVPLLAVLGLVGLLAMQPACTRVRPDPIVSPSTTPVQPAATEPPAKGFPSPSATPDAVATPEDERSFTVTPKPVVVTPKVTLPPASAPPVASAPSASVPPPGSPKPTPAAPIPSPTQGGGLSVAAQAASQTDLKSTADALTASGLAATLGDGGPFTLFAPTNAAWAALPAGTLESLLRPENKARLTKILSYHVVPGRYTTANLRDADLPTLEGQTVAVKTTGGPTTVGGATVTKADVGAGNGVIHFLDAVLFPPDLAPEQATLIALARSRPELKTLVTALDLAGLNDVLTGPGPFTLFAPTDAAFEKLPAGTMTKLLAPENKTKLISLLTFHVARGSNSSTLLKDGGLPTLNGAGLSVVITGQPVPRVGGASVILADLFAGNGVGHLIDSVMVPPGYLFP